jgi:hypothetical protein
MCVREREKIRSNGTDEKMERILFSPFISYSFLTAKKKSYCKKESYILSGWITSMNYNIAQRSI